MIQILIDKYDKEPDIMKRLQLIYDFVDLLNLSTHTGKQILNYLIVFFNNDRFSLSEIKTVLVISKPFINDPVISGNRVLLLNTYNRKKVVL